MSILIGGDIFYYVKKNDSNKINISNKLLKKIRMNDNFIVNLEGPITNSCIQKEKIGINLKNPIFLARELRRIGVTIAGISNNHIMDFGVSGLEDTIKICNDNNITCVGAGNKLCIAQNHVLINDEGSETMIIAVSEDEFCWAKENSSGTNPLDIMLFYWKYQKLIKEIPNSIVLIHGGKEYLKIPSPRMRNISKFMVDMGVDLVVWQHSHCIGCYEHYKEKLIFYGQGNFVFNYPDQSEDFYNGVLIKFSSKKDKRYEFIFIKQDPDTTNIEEIPNLNEREYELPKENTDIFVKNEWNKICKYYEPFFLKELSEIKFNQYTEENGTLDVHSRENLFKLHNLLKYESNLEVILTILDNLV